MLEVQRTVALGASFNGTLRRNAKSFQDASTFAKAWGAQVNLPTDPEAYNLVKLVGRGSNGQVWLAKCKTFNDLEVAVKQLDLDDLKCPLEVIIREAQVMKEQRHPNVLPLLCSFVNGNHLWMVLPYIAGGSLMQILQASFPEGMEEAVVATVGREVLKGLEYMHNNGRIHRDVKAANVLVSVEGNVVLSDFGVTAKLERAEASVPLRADALQPQVLPRVESWAKKQYLARNTFCGTPCFMAPEVMEQTQGYNTSADIWSFGILLEELATGRAPYSQMSLTSVILTTLHQDAPTLERQKNHARFSEDLHDIVRQCLQKDPDLRPSASQLLRHRFFKRAHDHTFVAKKLMPETDRSSVPLKERLKTIMSMKNAKQGSPKGTLLHTLSGGSGSFNAYATATLSGDVANALSLLKRMTTPSTKKQRAGLLIPDDELERCQGVAFCILRRQGGEDAYSGKGSGFVVARQATEQKQEEFHYRQMTKRKEEVKQGPKELPWSAPSYFEITAGAPDMPFEHEEVEVVLLLNSVEAVEAFQQEIADVDGLMTDEAHILAYGLEKDEVFDCYLDVCRLKVNSDANARIFGHTIGPVQLLNGEVRPPSEFHPLYRLLAALTATDAGSSMLGRKENEGSTLLYRLPIWLYDD